jgi:hypothetical protein
MNIMDSQEPQTRIRKLANGKWVAEVLVANQFWQGIDSGILTFGQYLWGPGQKYYACCHCWLRWRAERARIAWLANNGY